MIAQCAAGAVVAVCVWGVLDRRLQTRTAGTVGLSIIAILALGFFL